MRRDVRNYIATACFALFIVGFLSYLWLFFQYQSTRPNHPRPELGFVHVLNNHGSYVYVSDAESTGLALLLGMCSAGLLLFLIAVPKLPRGIEEIAFEPSVLWIALICYLGIIIVAGARIAAFVVSRGFVL